MTENIHKQASDGASSLQALHRPPPNFTQYVCITHKIQVTYVAQDWGNTTFKKIKPEYWK